MQDSLPKKITEAIREGLKFPKREIKLHEPKFIGKESQYLKNDEPCTPCLYGLPKIHKDFSDMPKLGP